MSSVKAVEERLLDFARGHLHWSELEPFGVNVEFNEWSNKLSEPAELPECEPSVVELANGLLRWRDDGPENLRQWAFVLLGVGAISLDQLETTRGGDTFLETLWDLSGGLPVKDDTWELIFQLAERPVSPGVDRLLFECEKLVRQVIEEPASDANSRLSGVLKLLGELRIVESDLHEELLAQWRNTIVFYDVATMGMSPGRLSSEESQEFISRAKAFLSAIRDARGAGAAK